MTDIICPLCGKPNPPELDECQYCQAPLKTGGFIAPSEDKDKLDFLITPPEEVSKAEQPPITPKAPTSLEQSIPDWLKETEASFLDKSDLESEEPSPDELSQRLEALLNPPSSPPPSTRESQIDDAWLASLLAAAGAGEPEKIKGTKEPAEVLPESLVEPISEGPVEQPVEEPGEKMVEGSAEEQASEIEKTFKKVSEILPEVDQALPAIDKPEWLAALEASSTIKLEEGMPASQTIQPEVVGGETAEEKEPEPPETPEWLTKPSAEPITPTPKEPEPPIAPAEIPGWLEALRPVEAITPTGPVEDVSGADLVTAGPLVGLRGVISARPSAIRAQKPPTYSIKLRVTDEQAARVQMMEELLEDEGKPAPLPSQPVFTTRYIFRLIVALVLLLPIIWMIIAKSQNASTPQPGNIPGVVEFTNQIQRLPIGGPVLVAFDYEAGYIGEMNIAISNVINQLIHKNAYLVFVATNPSGPALAESMIQDGYKNYANMGYIPGGTMGLQALAASPESLLPYTLNEDDVWAGAPLNSVSSIKDFAAVIVLTNDPDTARIWIEQVGPTLATTPLLFVTSAQAEPLIRPYFQAIPAQVQGMIAGLTGGLAYARNIGDLQQNGIWDAYSIGVTISFLVILVGSIAGWVLKMIAANKKEI